MQRTQQDSNRETIALHLLLGLFFGLTLASCAGNKTYVLQLRPYPAGEHAPKSAATVGLLPFVDDRPSPQVLGERVLSKDKREPILLESPSPSEDVTYILRRSLKARDIRVVELSSRWDLTAENLKTLPEEVTVAIAGRIESLEIEAQSSMFKTLVRYRVRLSAHIGFKGEGRVVTNVVEVSPEETMLRFNPEEVATSLNEALATALDQLVETALSTSDSGP